MNRQVAIYELRSTPRAHALVEAFRREGATVEHYVGDFVMTLPSLDTLLLVLPTHTAEPTLELSDRTWDVQGSYALTRYFHIIKEIGARLIEQRLGSILVVGGLAGLTGFPGCAVTSAVEGALIALTRSLACEWAEYNVRLAFLACGAIEGESLSIAALGEHTITGDGIARTPLKRAATLEEIAQTALYLASDRASFITGSVIRIDGGWTSWGLLK